MEEFKYVINSCKGYWMHLKKLLTKVAHLIKCYHNNATESDIPSLTDLHDHLWLKGKLTSNLNTQILIKSRMKKK